MDKQDVIEFVGYDTKIPGDNMAKLFGVVNGALMFFQFNVSEEIMYSPDRGEIMKELFIERATRFLEEEGIESCSI